MPPIVQARRLGINHLAGAQIACQVLQWATFFGLARLLTPHEFGTVAAVLVCLDLTLIVADLGMGAALIQRQELTDEHTQAAFWLNLAVGCLLALVAMVCAPWVAAWFRDPSLAPLISALPPALVLAAAGVVPQALIERDLGFQSIAGMMMASQAAYALTTLAMTLAGAGPWSVVQGMIAWHAVRVIMLWLRTTWRPRFTFSLPALRAIGPFSLSVLSASLVGYAKKSLEVTLIGYLLGPVALGIYSLAYRLITWPLMRISILVTKVAFPVMSRLQDDDQQMQTSYLKLITGLSAVTFPLLAGLAALAPEIIPLLCGEAWGTAVLPTQILCLIGMLKAIGTTDGVILFSKGRAGLEATTNVVSAMTLAAVICTTARYGLNTVVAALTLVGLITFPLYQQLINRQIGLPCGRFWSALVPAVTASALLFGTLQLYRQFAHDLARMSPWRFVLCAIPIALGVYLPLLQRAGLPVLGIAARLRRQPAPPAPHVP